MNIFKTFEECYDDPVGTVYLDTYRYPSNGASPWRFVILRGPISVCGYIGVYKRLPIAAIDDYDEMPVRVHGGFTYFSKGEDIDPDYWIGSRGQLDEFNWYGYDHGHMGDRCFFDIDFENGKFGYQRSPEDAAFSRQQHGWTPAEVDRAAESWVHEIEEALTWSRLHVWWYLGPGAKYRKNAWRYQYKIGKALKTCRGWLTKTFPGHTKIFSTFKKLGGVGVTKTKHEKRKRTRVHSAITGAAGSGNALSP